jgi:plasmid replication initiation protein
MTFNIKLANFLKEMQWVYSKITLKNLGRLQSRYAIRLYEIAISYSSLQGKGGNPEGICYFEKSLAELRFLFNIGPDEYKDNYELRRNVIDKPAKEVNNAEMGVSITPISVKQGRNLSAMHLEIKNEQSTPAKTPKKPRKKKTAPIQPELVGLFEDNYTDKQLEKLKKKHPEEFAQIYAEELARPSAVSPDNEIRQIATETIALARLKEKYGLIK